MSLRDFTKQQILQKYSSLDEFLRKWNSSDRKDAIIAELEEQGVLVDELLQAVNRECDLFDIICHVAFDMPPLTRRERANSVKKRNYFTKYGDKARKVLEALLDKYADEGVQHIEDMKILKINPFDSIGTPVEILNEFGDKPGYLEAVRELEKEIYTLRTS
jgi:type I restriction enzyme R subunit